ncbi:gamma-aminobutyrate transaminase POP2 [Cucumis melo var. makuwa]|uniref:Gamma-aminobutyrate transaminase POP2 n=1 Tax=Cucumis melo var. makuwa TaxID=1194695 RepID=A0A5A7UWT9_CUCMM|nr:gamma-aminobutyrate transaminase POP2 [Cucumis melo var. makuwa]TYK21632.1 gamma-aminobutyrate transaminase POP2 [Cucumis melo var. makuwa]
MSLTTLSTMWMSTCHIQAKQATMTNYSDEPRTMSSFPRTNFLKTDAMFLEFTDDLDNLVGGVVFSGRQFELTPRRRVQSRLLELERHVAANGWIPMMIALAMNRFVEYQMLNTFKEFRGDYHMHFKKYSDPEQARANHHTYWCNYGQTRLLDRSNLTIIAEGQSHFYNNSTSLLSKEGSRSTVWSCSGKHTFETGRLSPGYTEDAHPQPTLEGSQPLSRDEICETVLDRRPRYSKDLGWGSKLKACKMTSASSSTTSCPQSIVEL